ncbi:MAG: YciI family protein, partial [Stellaceae bacterium]
PNWLAGQPVSQQDRAVFRPHLIRMRALYDRGAVIFGGPTKAGFGGMAIMETATAAEASELMREDPAVLAGLLTYEVTELDPYFDAFASRAWAPRSR